MRSNLFYKLLPLLAVPLIVSCSPNPKATVIIEDASIPYTEKVVVNLEDGEYVDKLNLHISGNINDTARIGDPLAYHYYILPGKVDTTLRTGDYYSPGYTIIYDPMNATEGSLQVVVEFIAF